jgi:TraM recognition site of TraD and TraG
VAELRWFRLRWPREVLPDQVEAAFRLLVTTTGAPVVLELIGIGGTTEHRVALPAGTAENVVSQLQALMPGLSAEAIERETEPLARAIELRLTTRRRPLRDAEQPVFSQAVLTALAGVRRDERVVLQWVLGKALRPLVVPERAGAVSDSWWKDLLYLPLGKSTSIDSEVRRALEAKQGEPGWRAAGRIGVAAKDTNRQRQLIRQVLAVLRGAESPGLAFWVRSLAPSTVATARLPRRFALRLNVPEMARMSGWPAGSTGPLPVVRQRSRLLPPTPRIPSSGRVIGEAAYPGRERPLAISAGDARRHLEVLGPSGVGKSVLLGRLIAQDMAAGRGVVVVEPKSDLINYCLTQIPKDRMDDVVLIAPDRKADAVVGFNSLASNANPEAAADQLLAVFRGLYGTTFGPRTTDIAGAALHTLARVPGMTLAALPLLLTDVSFRRRIVGQIDDPVSLSPFWEQFEQWSPTMQAVATAPLLSRVRPFLLRPQLRAVLGQSQPRFDIEDVFRRRRILLVDCSVGQLGPEVAALLGSLIFSQVWSAVVGRSAIAPERRHLVSIVLDEFQTFVRLPGDFGDALAMARGLGCSITLAHQYLHQLEQPMRSAVLANAQNKVTFRVAEEDARVLATPGSGLAPEDFASLDAFRFYAQLVAGDAVQPWCSGRSLPPEPAISDPDEVRAVSLANYGRDRAEVEAELRTMVGAADGGRAVDDFGPRRRGGGRS